MTNPLFPHYYEWRILRGFPANQAIKNFPPNLRNYSEGFIVEIIPRVGKPWIGNFQGGSPLYLSGVYPTPKDDTICIVSGGDAYVVNTEAPEEYTELPVGPVNEVRSLIKQALLILTDFTSVVAIDGVGIRWKADVSRDGIKITQVTNEKILGLAWDPAKDREVNFEVNLSTGDHIGGSFY